MSTDNPNIPGIVKDGVVVPRVESPLPEGVEVDIVVRDEVMTPELKAELAAGVEAWEMIDEWEREDSE